MSTLKPGHIWIEVLSGPAGPCLCIAGDSTGFRLAGPKPWGGGKTVHRFQVDVDELVREANSYVRKPESPPCPK